MNEKVKLQWNTFHQTVPKYQLNMVSRTALWSKIFFQKCPYRDLCVSCDDWKIQNCCIFLRCILEKDQLDYVDSICATCTSWEDCKRLRKDRQPITPFLEKNMLNISKASQNLNSIPSISRFIPRIDLGSKINIETQLKIISQAQMDCLVVGLEKKLYHGKFKRLTFVNGENPLPLHESIHFDGKILLATNIRDEFCHLSFQDPEHYMAMIEMLQPDAVTTADGAFQYTKPLFVLEDQLNKVFMLNQYLAKLNLPLIGLLQPYAPFIPFSLKHFTAMDLKVVALPAQELSKNRSSDNNAWGYLKKLNQCLFNTKYKDAFQFLGLSMSPSPELAFDYCSSLSWRFVQKSKGEKKSILQFHKLRKYEETAQIQASNASFQRKSQNIKKLFGDLNGFKYTHSI